MKKIDVNTNKVVNFTNNTFSCIGTGRMDLALHKEYLDQLALVQKEIGFDYIRGMDCFVKIWQFIRSAKRRTEVSSRSTILRTLIR